MKVITIDEAVKLVKDGQSVMIGGFGKPGEPRELVHALAETDVKDLYLITNAGGSDGGGDPEKATGVARLIHAKKVRKMTCSHIGQCKEAQRQMIAGDMEVELTPQGTFIERIRCGGMGLGGFLTETGVGTLVAEGKESKVIDGVEYLFELPLHADVALVCATKADKYGNLYYHASSKNFNVAMATAADTVIALVDELVDEINPDVVGTPGILVDYVISRK